MLLEKKIANEFLDCYKSIMKLLNGGREPDGFKEYVALRPLIFEDLDNIDKIAQKTVGVDFINAVKSGIFGKFVYLKKYQKGYILQNIETGKYYQAVALTTPLEELVANYSVIKTALIPYENRIVCDGLIVSCQVSIGKNMAKDIREGYWRAKHSGELITNA